CLLRPWRALCAYNHGNAGYLGGRNRSMRRALVSTVLVGALVALFSAPAAQADIVNQFNFQLKDVTSAGQYTVVFSSRSYDTSGAVPPQLTRSYIRIPVGAKMRPEFFKPSNSAHLCDFQKIHDVKNPDVCKGAQIGRGTAKADPRLIINPQTGKPYVSD